MSVSGKTAIGQVVSGVRLIHDEKNGKIGCWRLKKEK